MQAQGTSAKPFKTPEAAPKANPTYAQLHKGDFDLESRVSRLENLCQGFAALVRDSLGEDDDALHLAKRVRFATDSGEASGSQGTPARSHVETSSSFRPVLSVPQPELQCSISFE